MVVCIFSIFLLLKCNMYSSSPYMSADLEKMAAAFNTTISALEDELMALILEGQIQARIDSHNKVNFKVLFLIALGECYEEYE